MISYEGMVRVLVITTTSQADTENIDDINWTGWAALIQDIIYLINLTRIPE